MIFESKNLVGDKPEWSVDTDTQTVTHIHPRTGETEEHRFFETISAIIFTFVKNITQNAYRNSLTAKRSFSISLTLMPMSLMHLTDRKSCCRRTIKSFSSHTKREILSPRELSGMQSQNKPVRACLMP